LTKAGMLYRFKSKVTGDVIMLVPQAQQLLALIGKATPTPAPGVLLPQDMAPALSALDAAVHQETAQRQAAIAQAQAEQRPAPRLEGVSLRQRVLPFQNMLRACSQAQEPIVWEV
jgi:hypothetical protein